MAGSDKTLPEVYLQPGESHLATEPAILRTVLGSCVGVAFWVPRWKIGALCHPMLPRLPQQARSTTTVAARRRYVDFAIEDMARQIDELGVPRADVKVKLFGGADVLQVVSVGSRPTVGQMNRDAADCVLADEGLQVVASSLGGNCGIHIAFHTGTGEVLLRRLS
jgi:chemotaxis protein CheD